MPDAALTHGSQLSKRAACAAQLSSPLPTWVHQAGRRAKRRRRLVGQRQGAAHRDVAPLLLVQLADL